MASSFTLHRIHFFYHKKGFYYVSQFQCVDYLTIYDVEKPKTPYSKVSCITKRSPVTIEIDGDKILTPDNNNAFH